MMFNKSCALSLSSLALLVAGSCFQGCTPAEQPPPTSVPTPPAQAKRGGPGGPMGVPSNPKIREAMGRLGKDENSLTAMIGKKLESDSPDWNDLGTKSKEYVNLVTGLVSETPTKGEKDTWSKHISDFVKSTQSLNQAIADKKLNAAKAAHAAITDSCMSCHRDHRAMPPSRGRGGPAMPGIPEVSPGPGAERIKSQETPAPAVPDGKAKG